MSEEANVVLVMIAVGLLFVGVLLLMLLTSHEPQRQTQRPVIVHRALPWGTYYSRLPYQPLVF